jgi:hypothetical protein
MLTPETFDQQIRELRQRQPFQPFLIELENGECLVVNDPQAIMYPQAGRSVFSQQGGFSLVDCESVRRIVELTATSA